MRKVVFAAVCVMILAGTAFGAAFSDILKKAEQGDANAQLEVWTAYFRRGFRDISEQKAKEFLTRAAEQGNVEAMYWLGVTSPTIDWLVKAAELGNADAQVELGAIYENGGLKGVKADHKKAAEWYQKAADQGDPRALENLGEMYEKGLGVDVDYNKAIEYYERAAARLDGGSSAAIAKKNLARLRASHNIPPQKPPVKQNPPAPAQHTAPMRNTLPPKNPPAPAQHTIPVRNTLPPKNTAQKPRIAILAFQDKSEEKNAPADAIMDMMVTELHGAEIFSLVEREMLDAIAKEINLGQSGLVDASTAPEIGKITGAQYIMTGAVTLYYYSEKASGFVFPVLGASTRAKTAYVVIDIRIIDVATSQIVYASAQTGESKQTSKQTNVLLGRNYSKMVGGLLSMAARNSVMKHVSAIRAKTW